MLSHWGRPLKGGHPGSAVKRVLLWGPAEAACAHPAALLPVHTATAAGYGELQSPHGSLAGPCPAALAVSAPAEDLSRKGREREERLEEDVVMCALK